MTGLIAAMILAGSAAFVDIDTEVVAQDETTVAEAPAAWDVGALATRSEIVAVGTVQAIGLDPTSRHPRIVGQFVVEEAIAGVRRGETFTVVWTAPLPKRTKVPEAGQKIVLFGNDGLDGLVRPAGNGSGVFQVVPGSANGSAGAYRDLRDWSVDAGLGREELLPLDRFVQALRDAR